MALHTLEELQALFAVTPGQLLRLITVNRIKYHCHGGTNTGRVESEDVRAAFVNGYTTGKTNKETAILERALVKYPNVTLKTIYAREIGVRPSIFKGRMKNVKPRVRIGFVNLYDRETLAKAWREYQDKLWAFTNVREEDYSKNLTKPELVELFGVSAVRINNLIVRKGVQTCGKRLQAGRMRSCYNVGELVDAEKTRIRNTKEAKLAAAEKARFVKNEVPKTASAMVETRVLQFRKQGMKVLKIARILKVDPAKVLKILGQS